MMQSDLIGRAKILDTERNLCGVLARPFPSPIKGLKVKGRVHETSYKIATYNTILLLESVVLQYIGISAYI